MNTSTPQVEVVSNPMVGYGREKENEIVGEFDLLYQGGNVDNLEKEEVEGDLTEGRMDTEDKEGSSDEP